VRRARTAAWQYEACQGWQSGIHRSDFRFQPDRSGVGHAQPITTFARHREVGTDIEQIVLDARQHGIHRRHIANHEAQDAYGGIGLIHRADRGDAGGVLAEPRAIAE
jgi:hypothetical protein